MFCVIKRPFREIPTPVRGNPFARWRLLGRFATEKESHRHGGDKKGNSNNSKYYTTMKKFLFSMAMLLGMAVSSQAMSYEQARQQALFLADKMAYELNLTEEQYEACYEVNLDYFMRISSVDDLYGDYWTRRNLDLSYILLDWQYKAFLDATYFYRPLYWSSGYWHFGIYARYPHRNYFYFGRPAFWSTYHGDHAWHRNGGHSWYHGREFARGAHGEPGRSNRGSSYSGMRDGFNNGKYGRGHDFGKDKGRDHNSDMRGQSSTRSTVGNTATPGRSDHGTSVNRGTTSTGKSNGGSQTGRVVSSQRTVGGSAVNRGSSTSSSRSSGITQSTSRSTTRVGSSSSNSRSMGSSSSSSVGSSRSSSGSRGGVSGGGSRSGGSSSGGSHGGRR